MAISESLLKRAEAAFKNADPSVFKKSSPFSGLAIRTILKNPRLKSSGNPCRWKNRFEIVSEEEAAESAKEVLPKNTEKNDRWAINTFKAWRCERNERCEELCGEYVLESCDAELLNKWLSLFVMEVRSGSRYPPASIHLLLCGLQRYTCVEQMTRLSTLPNGAKKDVFYFSPLQNISQEEGKPWFSAVPVGKNILDRYVKDMCLQVGIEGKTNDSLRATGTTRMYRRFRGPPWWNGPL